MTIEQKFTFSKNPNLTQEEIFLLMNDKNPFIRASLAENPNIDLKCWETLFNDEDYLVKAAALGNVEKFKEEKRKIIANSQITTQTGNFKSDINRFL